MANTKKNELHCVLCGRNESQATFSVVLSDNEGICDYCALQIHDIIDSSLPKIGKEKQKKSSQVLKYEDLPTPRQIKEILDGYVIGQDDAKVALSVAVYNHYGYDISEEALKEEALSNYKEYSSMFYYCLNNSIDISETNQNLALEDIISGYVAQGYEDAEVRSYYTEDLEANQLKEVLVENIFVDYITTTYFSSLS